MTGPAARGAAARLLAAGVVGDGLPPGARALTAAVPVRAPDGRAAGWVVGVVSGGRVAGFAQFDQQGGFVRYASLQRRSGSLDGCPERATWSSARAIAARAAAAARAGEVLGKPFLSFDVAPTRLAWIVPAKRRGDETVHIFVAGDAVYRRSPGR